MNRRLTYLFAGGGTGGHLFPGIAVAEELLHRDPQARVLLVGSERDVERAIVGRHGYEHWPLPVEPPSTLRRRPIRFAWRNWQAFRAAKRILRDEQPAVVIGLGGFASVPVAFAADRIGLPVVLLEQNVIPGRATRWLCRRAAAVCLSFAETTRYLPASANVCVTGNPVRREIARLKDVIGRRVLDRRATSTIAAEGHPRLLPSLGANAGAPTDHPVLLILGGSQGAEAVNAVMLQAAEKLRRMLTGWQIVHQTGEREFEAVCRDYRRLGLRATLAPFFDDVAPWYHRADLAVSRAGATTLAELACAGCPAILIPYPHAIGDHQTMNARFYESGEAARVVAQKADLRETAGELTTQLQPLLADSTLRDKMRLAMSHLARPDAAAEVADCIVQASVGSRSDANSGTEDSMVCSSRTVLDKAS